MKKIINSIIITIILSISIYSQHLPLKIGNQWHYDPSGVPGGEKYAAIVVDSTTINNKTYFKIERRHAFTGVLLGTTYDRLEGDSAYYRIKNDEDSLIINFNWPEGFVIVTTQDSICFEFIKLWNVASGNFWGFSTLFYQFKFGFWCVGSMDTSWTIFAYEITRLFGCRWAGEGMLMGAIIDGVTYGTLYPLPVELLSFTCQVDKDVVALFWQTATEMNNSGFEIERAPSKSPPKGETSEWQRIGFVEGKGTTTEIQSYSFTDKPEPGMYKYRLKQIDYDGTFAYSPEVEAEVKAPNVFSLEQNYPNPFNPSTKIKYQIPASSLNPFSKGEETFVTLKVYDILGNEVATLVNEEQAPGVYEVEFNVAQVSRPEITSGIYFYQLRTGEFNQTKKMILLK
jgi:hypothetical protein